MSIRRFNGWEPTETHTYLDHNGDLCRAADAFHVVVTREPEFDRFDREHFEVELDLEADTCGGCGGLLSETTGEPHGYDVDHRTCWRCYALQTRQEELAKAADGKGFDTFGNPIRPAAEDWTAAPLPT